MFFFGCVFLCRRSFLIFVSCLEANSLKPPFQTQIVFICCRFVALFRLFVFMFSVYFFWLFSLCLLLCFQIMKYCRFKGCFKTYVFVIAYFVVLFAFQVEVEYFVCCLFFKHKTRLVLFFVCLFVLCCLVPFGSFSKFCIFHSKQKNMGKQKKQSQIAEKFSLRNCVHE